MVSSLLNFVEPERFADQARQMLSQVPGGGQGDPHLSLNWFALLAEKALPEACKVALCPVGGGAFLPLMRMPCSSLVTGVSTFYTPLFGLVAERGATSESLVQLAKALAQKEADISEIRLAPMDSDSASWPILRQAFRQTGWLVSDYFCFGNWYHLVREGGYANYLASRPGALRNTLKRQQRQLAAIEGVKLQIYTGVEADLDIAINDFVAVYAASWKEAEPYPEFVPALCHQAGEDGSLRLGILKLAGRAMAAQLWLVANDAAYIVKLAYDPAFAHYSPGTVLSAAMFERVIDIDQVAVVDYLIGDDPYKRDWMSLRRERHGLVAYNPRCWRGLYGAVRHWAGKLHKGYRKLWEQHVD